MNSKIKKLHWFTWIVLTLMTATAAKAASTLRFSTASQRAPENAGQVTLTVLRSGDIDTSVTVEYATAENTAHAGEDFLAASGGIVFASGETNKTISIEVVNDGVREIPVTENFTVLLTNATANAVLGSPAMSTVTIEDNDTGLQFEYGG